VLSAQPRDLLAAAASVTPAVEFLGLLQSAFMHSLVSRLPSGPVMSNSAALLDYLRLSMGYSRTEQLRVLFLDAGNRLIKDEIIEKGSASGVTVPSRKILARALEVDATALILVHNHPSGSTAPSLNDIESTRALATSARPLDIVIHDHLIVSSASWTSLKSMGVL